MKEKPILFSGPMVRAILEGRKTQTRREVKPQPTAVEYWLHGEPSDKHKGVCSLRDDKGSGWTISCGKFKPFYWMPARQVIVGGPIVPADRLWVKETFYYDICPFANGGSLKEKPADFMAEHFYYRADGTEFDQIPECQGAAKWRPSIFMPRWASRITLEIVGVRVERLQDITEADAIAEGCEMQGTFPKEQPHHKCGSTGWDSAAEWYSDLWESINGPGSWDKNPWVWVIEFKRI